MGLFRRKRKTNLAEDAYKKEFMKAQIAKARLQGRREGAKVGYKKNRSAWEGISAGVSKFRDISDAFGPTLGEGLKEQLDFDQDIFGSRKKKRKKRR